MSSAGKGKSAGKSGNATKRKRKPAKPKTQELPRWNVILLDDNDHSYEYVVEMLQSVFAHPPEKGFELAKQVDSTGRAIVLTTHRELAELKRDQIIAYGADPRIERSQGSMTAIIEKVE